MSSAGSVSRNILSLSSACTADGILCGDGAYVRNNSIYADGAGSCSGLKLQASRVSNIVSNNLIEGFSGASGVGIEISGSSHHALLGGNNSVYDCTTNISGTLVSSKLLAANEELTTSPFTDAANGNFNPVDTGSIKEGSLPETWNN
jgi:type 1 fimbria pilin